MKKTFAALFILTLVLPFSVNAAEKNYLDAELNQAVPNAKILAIGIIGGGEIQEADLPVIQEQKFTTVIDLRTKEEGIEGEREAVKKLGMIYVNIPMKNRTVTEEHLQSLKTVLSDQESYPVLMHCRSGGRVDALWKEYRKVK